MFHPNQEHHDLDLEKLIHRSNKNQWSVDDAIDWSIEVMLPPEMSPLVYRDMVSQLYYAEEASVHLCARLIHEVPEFQAKRYLAAQAADEARHAQAYKMYAEKLGGLRPITEDMKDIFLTGLNWQGPVWGLVATMNIVLEHEALAQQKRRIKNLPCPLFKQINEQIIVDESRHCRFGVLYLSRVVPNAPHTEKQEVINWLQTMWGRWCKAHEHRYKGPGEHIIHLDQQELDDSWKARMKQFQRFQLFGNAEAA